jgi:outer membrane biosynthesis protein TonB
MNMRQSEYVADDGGRVSAGRGGRRGRAQTGGLSRARTGVLLSRVQGRRFLLSAVLACALFVALVSDAGATTYDIRGEWAYTEGCPTCGPPAEGTLLITSLEPSGKFSGSSLLYGITGTAAGMLNEEKFSLEVLFRNTPIGETGFTIAEGTIEAGGNSMSGAAVIHGGQLNGTSSSFTAQKMRSLQQIEKEQVEKAEKEATEEAEKEKTEKAEKEAQEKVATEKAAQAEKEAKEKAEKEVQAKAAQAKAEQEAKEKKEKEEAEEKSGTGGQGGSASGKPLAPANPRVKGLTVSGAGVLSLDLSNPNSYSITGEVTLATLTGKDSRKGKHRKGKPSTLASASYTVSAGGSTVVKLRLSKSGLAALGHAMTLHALVEITTLAKGESTLVKSYDVTLKAADTKHG